MSKNYEVHLSKTETTYYSAMVVVSAENKEQAEQAAIRFMEAEQWDMADGETDGPDIDGIEETADPPDCIVGKNGGLDCEANYGPEEWEEILAEAEQEKTVQT